MSLEKEKQISLVTKELEPDFGPEIREIEQFGQKRDEVLDDLVTSFEQKMGGMVCYDRNTGTWILGEIKEVGAELESLAETSFARVLDGKVFSPSLGERLEEFLKESKFGAPKAAQESSCLGNYCQEFIERQRQQTIGKPREITQAPRVRFVWDGALFLANELRGMRGRIRSNNPFFYFAEQVKETVIRKEENDLRRKKKGILRFLQQWTGRSKKGKEPITRQFDSKDGPVREYFSGIPKLDLEYRPLWIYFAQNENPNEAVKNCALLYLHQALNRLENDALIVKDRFFGALYLYKELKEYLKSKE